MVEIARAAQVLAPRFALSIFILAEFIRCSTFIGFGSDQTGCFLTGGRAYVEFNLVDKANRFKCGQRLFFIFWHPAADLCLPAR